MAADTIVDCLIKLETTLAYLLEKMPEKRITRLFLKKLPLRKLSVFFRL